MKRSLAYSLISAALFLLLIRVGLAGEMQPVRVSVEHITFPTYLLGPQEKHPMFKDYRFPGDRPFRSRRLVYPYTLMDEFTQKKKDVDYQAVILENEYIKVIILPELRGRIQAAIDKRNSWDFLYYNHVIKPADIAIRQAWVAGGLEWNHPQGHGYTQFNKISYKIIEGSDGSKTVLIAELEPNRMMKWEVAITLRPGRLYLETTGRFTSMVNYPIPFVSFQNAAVHTTEQTETIFPKGTWITGHGKYRFTKWPYVKKINVSFYKNLKGSFSVFADGQGIREDFFGVYSHDKNVGTVIVADHRKAPGKKYFSWGSSPKGRVWDRLLSDTDGPYMELQLGAFWDNLGYGYAWLTPLEEKEFTAYWYPIKDIGGFVTATKDLTLNVKLQDEHKIKIGIQSTKDFSDLRLVVSTTEKILVKKSIDLKVLEPFVEEFSLLRDLDIDKLEVMVIDQKNNVLIEYGLASHWSTQPRETPPEKPLNEMTIDELYNKAKSFYQDPFGPDAVKYYLIMIKRDSLESRANLNLGVLYYHRGAYDIARHYLKKALFRDPLNATAYKAHLYLGLIEYEQGNIEKARSELELATRFPETAEVALYYLGKIELALRHPARAISFFREAIKTAGNKAEIWASIAIAFRKAGMKKEALQAISAALKEDPLEFTAITEQWIWGEIAENQLHELFDRKDSTFIGSQLYMEQACKYVEVQSWGDAAKVLELALHHLKSSVKVYPMLEYYLGYVYEKMGKKEIAREYYDSASNRISDYVFPYRKLSIPVLRSALHHNPKDANSWLYLGNLLTYLRRHKEGLNAWQRAYQLNSKNTLLLRNLAHVVWYLNKDTTQAINFLERAYELDQLDTQVFLDLDRMYAMIEAEKMRIRHFEKSVPAIKNNDTVVHRWVTLILRLGHRALYKKNFSVAFGYFKKAEELMKKTYFFPREANKHVLERYAEACFGLAEAFLEMKKPKEALAELQQGLEYPDNLNVGEPAYPVRCRPYYLMGLAYEQLGNTEKAKEYFRKVVEERILPSTESIYYKALALGKLGKKDEAVLLLRQTKEILEKILRENQTERLAIQLYVLGKVYSALKDQVRAQRFIGDALAKDPDVVLKERIASSTIPWEGRNF